MIIGRLDEYPSLTAAAGKAHFCIPLTEVYERDDIRWPLSMAVNLMRLEDGVSTKSMVASRSYAFNATDVPSGALDRQAAAPPQEYQSALMKASGYYTFRSVLYKLCIGKNPDRQPAITKSYRDWESRNRTDIDLINQLQFESYREQVKGHASIAARIDDQAIAATRTALERMPAGDLQRQCDSFHGGSPDGDDRPDPFVADSLEVVRKYAPRPGKGSDQ
jgi:hypothetical protein